MIALLSGLTGAGAQTILDLKKGELSKGRADALVFYHVALGRGLRLEKGAWRLEAATRIGNWIDVDTNVTRIGEISKEKLLPIEYSYVRCFMFAPDGRLGQANPASTGKAYLCKFKDDYDKVYYSTVRENWGVVDREKLSAADLDSLVAFLATPRGKSAQFPFAEGGPAYNYRYEVRFDGQGAGSKPNPERMLAEPDRLSYLPDPLAKEGFAFDGWYTEKGGQGKPVAAGTRLDSDTVVYANWLKPYSASFDGNGAALDPQPAPMTVTARKGIASLPPEPLREGYFFGGWCFDKEGAKPYSASVPPNADFVLYAKWTKNFTITFDGSGADASFQPVAIQAGPKGLLGPAPTPTRSEYKFGGWFSKKDNNSLEESAPVGQDMSFYAKWLDLEIGDKGPAGGLIFYVNDDASLGWRYLEAAPGGQDKQIVWGKGDKAGTPVNLDTGEDIGSGRANSDLIAAYAGPEAAMNAHNLSIAGYTDWFYPSRSELLTMYSELARRGLLGGFERKGTYWSSSIDKSDEGCAYAVSFDFGGRPRVDMDQALFVRPIRAFGGEKGCEAPAPAEAIAAATPAKPLPASPPPAAANKPAKAVAKPGQAQADALFPPGSVFTGTITKVKGKNKISGRISIEILEAKADGLIMLKAKAEHQFEGQDPVSYSLSGRLELDKGFLYLRTKEKIKSPKGFEIEGWLGDFDPATGSLKGTGFTGKDISFEASLSTAP
jgi:uncharacterized repeat protein (TIGR02543 family)